MWMIESMLCYKNVILMCDPNICKNIFVPFYFCFHVTRIMLSEILALLEVNKSIYLYMWSFLLQMTMIDIGPCDRLIIWLISWSLTGIGCLVITPGFESLNKVTSLCVHGNRSNNSDEIKITHRAHSAGKISKKPSHPNGIGLPHSFQ